jgi:ribonuclease-3
MGTSMGHPPPPTTAPPPLPGNPAGTGAFLAMFNQMVAQRSIKVEWPAVQTGPGHALTWSVECVGEYSQLFDI